jgi:hypothetical protein
MTRSSGVALCEGVETGGRSIRAGGAVPGRFETQPASITVISKERAAHPIARRESRYASGFKPGQLAV